jgi:hypothetical protein
MTGERAACAERPPRLMLDAIELFNCGEFYAQHELLESLWRAEPRPVWRLYQGILQIGVAFHHLRRNNHHGAVYMLTRGQMHLRPFAPRCQGVDVERLLADSARALAEVARLGPRGLHAFDWSLVPKVRLLDDARALQPRGSGEET